MCVRLHRLTGIDPEFSSLRRFMDIHVNLYQRDTVHVKKVKNRDTSILHQCSPFYDEYLEECAFIFKNTFR